MPCHRFTRTRSRPRSLARARALARSLSRSPSLSRRACARSLALPLSLSPSCSLSLSLARALSLCITTQRGVNYKKGLFCDQRGDPAHNARFRHPDFEDPEDALLDHHFWAAENKRSVSYELCLVPCAT